MGAPERVPQAGWRAALDLGFEWRGDATRLAHRRHEGPLRIQRPLYPEGGRVCHAIVLHPPGGIAGGDVLTLNARVDTAAHALLTTPGATKWYRSGGATACQTTRLHVGRDAVLEWLPQEAIVFDGAQADMLTEVALSAGATWIGWDIVCFGRAARAERFSRGTIRMTTTVCREGKRLWFERAGVDGGAPLMRSAAGLNGHTVSGTLIAASPALSTELMQACREPFAEHAAYGVTMLPGLLVARYLGDSAETARDYFARIWSLLRVPLTGAAPMRPRIWST